MKEKLKEAGKNCVGFVLGIALVGFLISMGMKYQDKKEAEFPWRGAFYTLYGEDKTLTNDSASKTLDECRAWAQKIADDKGLEEGEWDYSCGTGCEFTGDTIVGGKEIHEYECSEVTK